MSHTDSTTHKPTIGEKISGALGGLTGKGHKNTEDTTDPVAPASEVRHGDDPGENAINKKTGLVSFSDHKAPIQKFGSLGSSGRDETTHGAADGASPGLGSDGSHGSGGGVLGHAKHDEQEHTGHEHGAHKHGEHGSNHGIISGVGLAGSQAGATSHGATHGHGVGEGRTGLSDHGETHGHGIGGATTGLGEHGSTHGHGIGEGESGVTGSATSPFEPIVGSENVIITGTGRGGGVSQTGNDLP